MSVTPPQEPKRSSSSEGHPSVPAQDFARRVRRVALIVLALVALALALVSLVRTVRSFYRLDFRVQWTSAGLGVERASRGSSAELAGLVDGELIVAIDGVAVIRLNDPAFSLATGDEHELAVRDPGGALREVIYRPPPPRVDAVYLVRSLVAVVALFAALYAALTTHRREATTFLLLAVAALMLATIPHRTAAVEEILRVLHRAAGAGVPFLLLRFFLVFPEQRTVPLAFDLMTAAIVAGGAALAVVPGADAWFPVASSLLRACLVFALVVGGLIQVQRWRAAARIARVRRQIEWLVLGMFVGLVPYLVLVMLPKWLGIGFEPFAWLAILPVVAVPAGFLAALAEYRLWDLEPITRDIVSATLVTVIGGLIFAATNRLLLTHAGGLGSVRNLMAFATGVLLVVLLQPVRLRVERFLDAWLHHGRPTPRWLLTHSTLDLAQATDPRELLRRLAETLREGLELDLVATYLRLADGSFQRVTASGGEPPSRLPATSPDIAFPHSSETALRQLGFVARIPLERAGTVHGLLYLGLRRGIFPLGTEVREVVAAFAAQVGLGLESARLLDDLRRQAEEYRILHANTQRIIESSAAAILVCDATGRILSANAHAAGIFSVAIADLVGVTLESLLELPVTWHPHLPLQAVNAEATTRGDIPVRRVILAISVLELDSGSFNGRVVVLQDVTELRELQDRVREQERLASLGRLASGLAHEINTPLTGIASFAQMLRGLTPEDDPRAELVAKLEDQSFRVARIVANLHEAVRGRRAQRGVLDLGDVVRRASLDAARSLAAGERLHLTVGTDQDVRVWGVQGPVELAVGNLVRNALEASPADEGIEVTVTANAGWGEVWVDDRGPGVPAQLREKVFEAFFSTKTERGGTGLGLAITRDMIAELGGEVRLEPSPAGGTRAVIRLERWEQTAQSS